MILVTVTVDEGRKIATTIEVAATRAAIRYLLEMFIQCTQEMRRTEGREKNSCGGKIGSTWVMILRGQHDGRIVGIVKILDYLKKKTMQWMEYNVDHILLLGSEVSVDESN